MNSGSAKLTGGTGGTVGANAVGVVTGAQGSNGKAVSGAITGTVRESENNSTWSYVSGTASDKQYVKVAPVHTHSFTYSASGATITVTCSVDGCDLTDGKATLTLAAPTLSTYGQTGEGVSAEVTVTDENSIQGDAATKRPRAARPTPRQAAR